MTHAITFLWLLPRNVCVVILRGYRAVISPLYGDVCRYYPSCSAYALQAIQRYGVFAGVWRGSLRIARCHPWATGGVDDVPQRKVEKYRVTRFGFVTTMDGRSTVTQHSLHLSHGHGKG